MSAMSITVLRKKKAIEQSEKLLPDVLFILILTCLVKK